MCGVGLGVRNSLSSSLRRMGGNARPARVAWLALSSYVVGEG